MDSECDKVYMIRSMILSPVSKEIDNVFFLTERDAYYYINSKIEEKFRDFYEVVPIKNYYA